MPFAINEHQTADLESTVRPARIVAETGSITLDLDHANRVVEVNLSTATTVTVPPDSSVPFPIGTVIVVYQHNAGVTISPGSGVTLRSATNRTGARTLAGTYAEGSLRKRASNDWVLVGNFT